MQSEKQKASISNQFDTRWWRKALGTANRMWDFVARYAGILGCLGFVLGSSVLHSTASLPWSVSIRNYWKLCYLDGRNWTSDSKETAKVHQTLENIKTFSTENDAYGIRMIFEVSPFFCKAYNENWSTSPVCHVWRYVRPSQAAWLMAHDHPVVTRQYLRLRSGQLWTASYLSSAGSLWPTKKIISSTLWSIMRDKKPRRCSPVDRRLERKDSSAWRKVWSWLCDCLTIRYLSYLKAMEVLQVLFLRNRKETMQIRVSRVWLRLNQAFDWLLWAQ